MMTTSDVLEAFELLEDWEARYEFIGELSQELLPLGDDERTEQNLVQGCNTRTWLVGDLTDSSPPTIRYRADAETPLVRGLVALLLVPFQGLTPEAVLTTDPSNYINKLGLKEHLSPNRQAGMAHFIDHLCGIARRLVGHGS